MSYPFIVREVTGTRAIILRGRSLPRQGTSWGGTQRVNINWMPGNPVATSQVIGATFKNTTIEGGWSSNFMQEGNRDHAPKLIGFPRVAAPPVDPSAVVSTRGNGVFAAGSPPIQEQIASSAEVVRDAFELIRRSGHLVRVEWTSIVRYGYIINTEFPHKRPEDIDFAIEFEWIGDTDSGPTPRRTRSTKTLSSLQAFITAFQAFIDSLSATLFGIMRKVRNFQQKITKIGSLITDAINLLTKFVELALVPAELLGTFKQQMTSIKLAAKDLLSTIRNVPVEIEAAAQGLAQDEINNAAALANALKYNLKKLGADAVTALRDFDKITENPILGIYISPGGKTLRDVATEFYGTPRNWTNIKDFNGLETSLLPKGTIVRVPRL